MWVVSGCASRRESRAGQGRRGLGAKRGREATVLSLGEAREGAWPACDSPCAGRRTRLDPGPLPLGATTTTAGVCLLTLRTCTPCREWPAAALLHTLPVRPAGAPPELRGRPRESSRAVPRAHLSSVSNPQHIAFPPCQFQFRAAPRTGGSRH